MQKKVVLKWEQSGERREWGGSRGRGGRWGQGPSRSLCLENRLKLKIAMSSLMWFDRHLFLSICSSNHLFNISEVDFELKQWEQSGERREWGGWREREGRWGPGPSRDGAVKLDWL